jgi:hypothetical protein
MSSEAAVSPFSDKAGGVTPPGVTPDGLGPTIEGIGGAGVLAFGLATPNQPSGRSKTRPPSRYAGTHASGCPSGSPGAGAGAGAGAGEESFPSCESVLASDSSFLEDRGDFTESPLIFGNILSISSESSEVRSLSESSNLSFLEGSCSDFSSSNLRLPLAVPSVFVLFPAESIKTREFLTKNLNNIQIYIKIIKLHLQNVSIIYQIPNLDDDSQLNDKQ